MSERHWVPDGPGYFVYPEGGTPADSLKPPPAPEYSTDDPTTTCAFCRTTRLRIPCCLFMSPAGLVPICEHCIGKRLR